MGILIILFFAACAVLAGSFIVIVLAKLVGWAWYTIVGDIPFAHRRLMKLQRRPLSGNSPGSRPPLPRAHSPAAGRSGRAAG